MCRIAELALDAAVARGECEPLPSGGIVASPVPCCCSEVAAAAEAAAAVATEAAFEAFFALAPADEAFIALADGLGRSDDEFTTGMIVELLGQYLEPGSIGEFDRGVRSRV